MKLGNYFQQTVPVKRKRETSIIITNDRIKKEFETALSKKALEMSEVQAKLGKETERADQHEKLYQDVFARYTEATEIIKTHERLDSTVLALRKELSGVQIEADKVENLEYQIKIGRDESESLAAERNAARRQVEITTEEMKGLQNTIEALNEELRKMHSVIHEYETKYPTLVKNYQYSQSQVEILQNTIEQQAKDVELLTTNFFHWKDAAMTLEEQLNEEAKLRDEIKQSLEILAQENKLDSKRITKSSQAYKDAKDEILNLTNRNLELTNFTEQMSKIIIGQRKAIASIGLSQAAIGAKEGFHIPFAKENLRTKQLGNAKPTLLKFKETTDDNN